MMFNMNCSLDQKNNLEDFIGHRSYAYIEQRSNQSREEAGTYQNLDRNVLILDISFEPVDVVNVFEAIGYILMEKATYVQALEDEWIHSAYMRMQYPSVLRLTQSIYSGDKPDSYTRRHEFSESISKDMILLRDRGKGYAEGKNFTACAYCNFHRATQKDHIVPKSKGGSNGWMNLISACGDCNQYKDDRTPEEAGMTFCYLPTIPPSRKYLKIHNQQRSEWNEFTRNYMQPMTRMSIVTYPAKILDQASEPVENIGGSLVKKIKSMHTVLRNTSRGVALAAIQVRVPKRLFIYRNISEMGGKGVLINPEIIEQHGEVENPESCLSLPNKSYLVQRPEILVVKGLDIDGNDIDFEVRDFAARMICHEIDHMNGKLINDNPEI